MDVQDSISFLKNEEIYEAVIERGFRNVTRSLDVATANVKDLRVPPRGPSGTLPSKSGKTAPSIVRVFRDLARKGVVIRLLHSGVPSGSFIKSFKKYDLGMEKNFTMRRCIRVHFKSVIFDGANGYIGSANLTGAGVGAKSEKRRNFEAGFLTEHPFIVEQVQSRFDKVFSGGYCDSCGRREICYVPLEEPDFG